MSNIWNSSRDIPSSCFVCHLSRWPVRRIALFCHLLISSSKYVSRDEISLPLSWLFCVCAVQERPSSSHSAWQPMEEARHPLCVPYSSCMFALCSPAVQFDFYCLSHPQAVLEEGPVICCSFSGLFNFSVTRTNLTARH